MCSSPKKIFGNKLFEHAFDQQLEISHRQHNKVVDKSRKILKFLIDFVCFLGQHELGIRDYVEKRFSSNRRILQNFVSLLKI